jgi:CheY-like chemotaxis protein
MATILLIGEASEAPDLGTWLGHLGHELKRVPDSGAAIVYLRAQRPDLVIARTRMKGMDGYAVARYVKTFWPGLPVVLWTSAGDEEPRKAGDPGAVAILGSSLAGEELMEAIEAHLPGDPAPGEPSGSIAELERVLERGVRGIGAPGPGAPPPQHPAVPPAPTPGPGPAGEPSGPGEAVPAPLVEEGATAVAGSELLDSKATPAAGGFPLSYFDGMAFGVLLIDINRVIVYANPTMRRWLNLLEHEPASVLEAEFVDQLLEEALETREDNAKTFFHPYPGRKKLTRKLKGFIRLEMCVHPDGDLGGYLIFIWVPPEKELTAAGEAKRAPLRVPFPGSGRREGPQA